VGHITIADGTKIGAQAGVNSTIKEPNKAWHGSPEMPYMTFMKSSAIFKKLPEMQKQIAELQKAIKEINASR